MFADLKPYPEYRESGSKWFGAVPAKWELRALRTHISKRSGRDRPDLPLLSVAREKDVFIGSLTEADENHQVMATAKIGGQARAMVFTSGIE